MKRAVLFAARDVRRFDAFDPGRYGFDVRDNGHLDDRMRRVVCLKLIAGFDGTGLVDGMKLYEDGANLPGLDDFFKVKVAGLASGRRGSHCGDKWNKRFAYRIPNRRNNGIPLRSRQRQSGFLRELQRLGSEVAHREVLLEFLAGEHVAKIATSRLHRYFGSVRSNLGSRCCKWTG